MFFALGGFLVAGSMERCTTLLSFLGLRILRIYPALAVEVLLSAFLIGPLATTLPLRTYFTSQVFLRYLVNVTGDITFFLPGVFTHNPFPQFVNLQLWTVPYDLLCYLILSLLILAGVKRNRGIILIAIGVGLAAYMGAKMLRYGDRYDNLGPVTGISLVFFFLSGIALYLYREVVRWNKYMFRVALVLSTILLAGVPWGECFATLPVAYFTVYLGLLNPKRIGVVAFADCSYGVFLYGFVIQQFLVFLLPSARLWYLNILIALPLSIAVGLISWHVVERPVLMRKDFVKIVEAQWLQIRPKLPGLRFSRRV